MIKPGRNDKKVMILISGDELKELQNISWMLGESFGLDRRIERYRGTKPIGLYSWDFDCLMCAVDSALKREPEYKDRSAPGTNALGSLSEMLKREYDTHFPNR